MKKISSLSSKSMHLRTGPLVTSYGEIWYQSSKGNLGAVCSLEHHQYSLAASSQCLDFTYGTGSGLNNQLGCCVSQRFEVSSKKRVVASTITSVGAYDRGLWFPRGSGWMVSISSPLVRKFAAIRQIHKVAGHSRAGHSVARYPPSNKVSRGEGHMHTNDQWQLAACASVRGIFGFSSQSGQKGVPDKKERNQNQFWRKHEVSPRRGHRQGIQTASWPIQQLTSCWPTSHPQIGQTRPWWAIFRGSRLTNLYKWGPPSLLIIKS